MIESFSASVVKNHRSRGKLPPIALPKLFGYGLVAFQTHVARRHVLCARPAHRIQMRLQQQLYSAKLHAT